MRIQSYVVPTLLLLVGSADALAETSKCGQLSDVRLPNTTVTTAESVTGGNFTPPYGDSLDKLPGFCRVAGVLKPVSDSYIRFEVWLPLADWNHRYLGVGNGGFAGSIDYRTLAGDLKRGYATAATDTGHEGDAEDASWAFHHPEKVADFGYRALHLTTETAKKLMEVFYGGPAEHSYFDSCSDGGREALMEAQRFPEDFDGILAGAPANFWTSLLTGGVEVAQELYGNPAAYLSGAKAPAIGAAVLKACDAQDGVTDGIVSDPERCHFDPDALLCKGAEGRDCLTVPQVASLKRLYAGSRDAQGRRLFLGYMPGGENGAQGWASWILGPAPGLSYGVGYVENYFRYIVFDDPTWNILTANVDAAKRLADQKTAESLNATNPDLRRFQARGGKLIMYHGWNDPAISPLYAVSYYKQVGAGMGAQNRESFLRLYMIPGMQHCIGGPGPSYFGQLGTTTAKGEKHGIYAALEEWVEKGTAPGEIVATKYVDNDPSKAAAMTRPLCAYPQIAKYKGAGDTNDYRNFTCEVPKE
ncbi:MAG TPA: tannase/feruloyl esterase family alpha/beta hydrolase [Bryobacteraceae bacterium]|nr:tannase/feruloyl esterase family alpha/beta hydrolase [Bryobacteraceae bacterium]